MIKRVHKCGMKERVDQFMCVTAKKMGQTNRQTNTHIPIVAREGRCVRVLIHRLRSQCQTPESVCEEKSVSE